MSLAERAEYYSINRLRWNTLVLIGGKGVNAALSLSLFALIASNLSKSEFAIYAWLLAFVELSTHLSRFGINWAVDRFVPQLRSTFNSVFLRRFILFMTGLRVLLIVFAVFAFYSGGHALLSLSYRENWLPAFDLYIVILIPFAVMTFLRDVVFQSLLQQTHSQVNTTCRNLMFLVMVLCAIFFMESLTLRHVIYGDLIATTAAAAIGLTQLGYLLRRLPYSTAPVSTSLPTCRGIITFAANSYASDVLRMSGSGYAAMTAAPHLLMTAALAPYGFCQTLSSQLNRFLPAHLLSGLYRPKLVAQYIKTGSFDALNRHLIIILKISNYALACGITLFFVYGEVILNLMSHGKYVDVHWLMLLFLALMLVDNHRQILIALCNTIEKVGILSRSSLLTPLCLPIAFVLVWIGLGPFGLVLSLIIADLLGVGAIVFQLNRSGYRLQFCFFGQLRIAATGILTILFGLVLQSFHPDSWFWNLAGMIATGLAFIAIARLLRPMTEDERNAIERMVGRPIYVL